MGVAINPFGIFLTNWKGKKTANQNECTSLWWQHCYPCHQSDVWIWLVLWRNNDQVGNDQWLFKTLQNCQQFFEEAYKARKQCNDAKGQTQESINNVMTNEWNMFRMQSSSPRFRSSSKKIRSSWQIAKICLKKWLPQTTRSSLVEKEVTEMVDRERKRNGAAIAKAGYIITAMHASDWKRINRTNHHGTKIKWTQREQNQGKSMNDGTRGLTSTG